MLITNRDVEENGVQFKNLDGMHVVLEYLSCIGMEKWKMILKINSKLCPTLKMDMMSLTAYFMSGSTETHSLLVGRRDIHA